MEHYEFILLGEIFREEKRQVLIKRIARKVRQDFISNDLKRLTHSKEILMNIDAIYNLESSIDLAQKIHREMKTDYYKFKKANKNVSLYTNNMAPASPQFGTKTLGFEASAMNFSTTVARKTGQVNLLSALDNDPGILLEQNKQLMISHFGDSFEFMQNRFIKTQGACLHFLNLFNMQKRFGKLLDYDFQFTQKVPMNIGVSFFDPTIKENVIFTFFPKGTKIPTKQVAKPFSTRSQVIKLKIVEGDEFLSCNSKCIEEFEVKLMDIIDCDGSVIKMKIDKNSLLTIAIFNGRQLLFQIRLLYKVSAFTNIYLFTNIICKYLKI